MIPWTGKVIIGDREETVVIDEWSLSRVPFKEAQSMVKLRLRAMATEAYKEMDRLVLEMMAESVERQKEDLKGREFGGPIGDRVCVAIVVPS